MNDERLGLISASKFEIIALCEGQPALEASLRGAGVIQGESPSNEFAEMGTRIHKARETGKTNDLSEEELAIYERGLKTEKTAFDDWGEKISTEHLEQRLWLTWPDGSPATSAKLDVLFVAGSRGLVIEWKSLYCSNLTPAERNYQGMVQAVCAAKQYNLDQVRVVFNKAMFGKIDMVEYGSEDLARAEGLIFQKLWAAKQPGAATHAGAWCRYCPCQPHCPSAAAYSLLPSVVAGVAMGAKKSEVVDSVARLCPADWKYIWERSSIIRNVLDATNACLKAMPADDLAELGLQIGEGRKLDPIVNVVGAYTSLEHQLPPEVLWGCLTMEKGKLVEAVAAYRMIPKREAADWVKEHLEPFIEPKRASGSVELL